MRGACALHDSLVPWPVLCLCSASTSKSHGLVLMQAYESLALLEGTSRMAQQALASGRSAKMNSRDAQNLSAYFNKVQRLQSVHVTGFWTS